MAMYELYPYDLHTVSAATVASMIAFWAKLPAITSGNTARILLFADSFSADDLLSVFRRRAVPHDQLPHLLAQQRTLYEQFVEQAVPETRYLRLFLIIEAGKSADETMLSAIRAYGLRANLVQEELPLPFHTLKPTWTRGVDEQNRHWGMVGTTRDQTGNIGLTCLHPLLHLPFPIYITLSLDTLERSEAIRLSRQKALSARLETSHDLDAAETAREVGQTARQFREEVITQGWSLHHLDVTILTSGATERELGERLSLIRASSGLELETWDRPIHQVKELFRTTPPRTVQGTLLTSRGLNTVTASALTFRRRTEKQGIYLGKDGQHAPVTLDIFNPAHPNYNMLVLGMSGRGKTFFIQLLAYRHLFLGVRSIIIDPQGNINWGFLGDDLVQTITLGTEQARINVLDLIYDEESRQIEHVLSFLRLMEIYAPHEAPLARSILDGLLKELYAPCWDDPDDPHRQPLLIQLQRRLETYRSDDAATMALVRQMVIKLQRYTVGGLSNLFAHRTSVDTGLHHAITIFDTSRLPDGKLEGNLRQVLLAALIALTNRAIRRIRSTPKHSAYTTPFLYIADEFGTAIYDEMFAQFMTQEFKTARARRVAMIAIDQDLPSLLGPVGSNGVRFGEPILANVAMTAVFFQRGNQREIVEKVFGEFPPSLLELIFQLQTGQCILQLPGDAMLLHVEASGLEKLLFSSQQELRSQREQIIQELR